MNCSEYDWYGDARALVAVAVAFKEMRNDCPARDDVHVYHWDQRELTLVRKLDGATRHERVASFDMVPGERLRATGGATDVLEIFDRKAPPQFSPVFCPTSRRYIHCIGVYAFPNAGGTQCSDDTLRLADETLEIAAGYLAKQVFPDTIQGDLNFAVAMLGAIVQKLQCDSAAGLEAGQRRVAPWLYERIVGMPVGETRHRRAN